MSRSQHAEVLAWVLVPAMLVLAAGCMVRTYDTPGYYRAQPQPRRVYARPQQAGAYGGATYGRPPQRRYAAGPMGGARYGAPAQPQYSPGAMGGARYGAPAQPQYVVGQVGTTTYGPPPRPQYAPRPAAPVAYGPPVQPQFAPRPAGVSIYVAPVAVQPQPMVTQPGDIWVPADRPEPVWPSQPLMAGQWYVVEAWGAFSCRPDHTDGVDPYYAYGPWYVGAQPQPWGQLLIDDRAMYETGRAAGHWVTYRQDHRYQTMILGNGNRPKLQISDARNGSWSDNRGGLWVRIYPAR